MTAISLGVLFYQTHEKECHFVPEVCPECGEQVSKAKLAKHLELSCIKRSITCNYCSTEMLADELDVSCGSYYIQFAYYYSVIDFTESLC